MSDVNSAAAAPSAAAPVTYNGWDEKGTPIVVSSERPSKADAAPAKESSDAQGEEDVKAKSSDAKPKAEKTAPASETGNEDTQELGKGAQARIRELNAAKKAAEERAAELERQLRERDGKKSDVKAEPSPAAKSEPQAPEKPKRPKLSDFDNDWDKYSAALEKHEDETLPEYYKSLAKWEAERALAQERTRQQQEAALKDLREKLADVQKRYPDFSEKTTETAKTLTEAGNIVSALVNDSEIFGDLLYVLSGDKAQFDELMALAKSNPGKAVRKVVLLEKLTMDELAKSKSEHVSKSEAPVKAEPRAPAPPKEVGGRGTPAEDPAVAAARSGDFRSFEAEQNRRAFTRA